MKTSSAVGPSASRDPIIVQSAIESPFGQVILCQINNFFHQLTQNKTTELILSDLHKSRDFLQRQIWIVNYCQKVCQKISIMKTNTGVFVVFKTKRELECQMNWKQSVVFITEIFWRTFWRTFWLDNWWSIFDVIKRLLNCSEIQNLHNQLLYCTYFGLIGDKNCWSDKE